MFQIAKRPYQSNQKQAYQPHQARPSQPVSFDAVRMLNVPCTEESWHRGTGTILYGTQLIDKSRFSVENVHYFCGIKQENDGSMNRFIHFFESLKKGNMESAMPFRFFMPIMHASFAEALNDATSIQSYEVYSIQHRFLKRDCSEYKNLLFHLATETETETETATETAQVKPATAFFPKQAHAQPTQPMKPTQLQSNAPMQKSDPVKKTHLRTFHVKADIQNDIYYVLHKHDEPITQTTMIAHIPNYKTSVMMNALFRNIKENRNLDALEESDDEDETDECSKLVDLDKCVKMECAFNARFKRWHPVAIAVA